MQKFCSKEIVKAMKLRHSLQAEIAVAKNKRIKFCPRPDCFKVVNKPPLCSWTNRVSCECVEEVCFKCGNTWHNGKCRDDGAFRFWLWRRFHHVARCPGCTIPTSRYNECNLNKIDCLICKTKWCWVCRRAIVRQAPYEHYEFINIMHPADCPVMEENVCTNSYLSLLSWQIFSLLMMPFFAIG